MTYVNIHVTKPNPAHHTTKKKKKIYIYIHTYIYIYHEIKGWLEKSVSSEVLCTFLFLTELDLVLTFLITLEIYV